MVQLNFVVRNFFKLEGSIPFFYKIFSKPFIFFQYSCQPFLADIWAMMVTLYVIMFRRYPFSNPDEIKQCQLDLKFLQSRTSDELYDLFLSTLIRQPYNRLTMLEIETHDWVQQPFSLESYSWNIVTQNSLGKVKGFINIFCIVVYFRRNIFKWKSFSKW